MVEISSILQMLNTEVIEKAGFVIGMVFIYLVCEVMFKLRKKI